MADAPAAGVFPRQSHVCALIESADDADALVPLFVRDGRDRGETVIAVAGGAWLERLRRQLDALNLRTPECEADGRLWFVPWTRFHSSTQSGLDVGDALGSMEQFFSGAPDGQRHTGVRIVENMDWVVSACGGSRQLADYERGVDRLVEVYERAALCVYDLSRLSGQQLIEILSTHPLAMIRGALVESPFYRTAA
jgi:hypothetical protein